MDEKEDSSWHLDKRVPIALIIVLLGNIGTTAWWAATASEKLASLERRVELAAPQADRLTRVEVKLDTLVDTMHRIESNQRRANNQ